VQSLVKTLTSPDLNEEFITEISYDKAFMPLGALSDNQLNQALEVLNDIERLLDNDVYAVSDFQDKLQKFCTFIPLKMEDFRNLKSSEILKELKLLFLRCKDYAPDVKLYSHDERLKQQNIVEVKYQDLNCPLESFDRTNEEFLFVENFAINSMSPAHPFHLYIHNVFKIHKQQADFKAHIGQRQLLLKKERLA